MGLLTSLDDGQIGAALLLFCAFLVVSLYAFSAGRPRALLRGLFWTLMDLLVAPFAFIRYAVFRLAQEGGKSVRIGVADPQFLLRTMVRVQLAVLFLSLSLVGAVGLLLVVDQSVPPEAGEARKQAARQLDALRAEELPAMERELRGLEAKLRDGSGIEQEVGQKRAAITRLENQASAIRSELLASDSREHFVLIELLLQANGARIRSRQGREEIREAVEGYLRQAPTPEEFDAAVTKYLDLLFQKAERDAEMDAIVSANKREVLEKRIAELQNQLAQSRKRVRKLEQDASWARILASVSGWRLAGGLLALLAVAWAVLWLGGVSIESGEIVIDIATNLRRLRQQAEGSPQGNLIQPPAGAGAS